LTGWSLRWLAPAAACLLLAVSVVRQGANISGDSQRAYVVDRILSNEMAYVSDTRSHGQNDFSFVTFGWTNLNGYTSSIPSFRRP
jgi:hypothetical protein